MLLSRSVLLLVCTHRQIAVLLYLTRVVHCSQASRVVTTRRGQAACRMYCT